MQKIFLALIAAVTFFNVSNAQNDTMYVMKAGAVAGKYNVNTQVDSIIFYQPTVTPLTVTNPTTGEIWMDRNLGASQVATSSTDSASYGDLYQWGRGTDGHESRASVTTSTLSSSDTPGHSNFILKSSSPGVWRSPKNDLLWQGVAGTNNPCPNGWRIPTKGEWDTERLSWSSNDRVGAFASPLKLPVAGNHSRINGTLGNVDFAGLYWSSTVAGSTDSWNLVISTNATMDNTHGRASGNSVRCLKD